MVYWSVMAISKIHHLALTVSNIDKSVDWYTTVLPFTKIADFEETGGIRRKAILVSEHLATRLGLVEHRGTAAGTFDERTAGLDHLSFAVDLADIDGFVEAFEKYGVVFSPPAPSIMNQNARLVVFRDPDNLQLELYGE